MLIYLFFYIDSIRKIVPFCSATQKVFAHFSIKCMLIMSQTTHLNLSYMHVFHFNYLYPVPIAGNLKKPTP